MVQQQQDSSSRSDYGEGDRVRAQANKLGGRLQGTS